MLALRPAAGQTRPGDSRDICAQQKLKDYLVPAQSSLVIPQHN